MNLGNDSGFASVNGIEMYYEVHGGAANIPLVLIHGGGSTIESNWGRMIPMLAKNRRVIAMELQAHGHSSDRDTAESFEQDAADVVALLGHLKVEKADIVGFSNGGTTTLRIATNYPQVVNRIVIISANYSREGMIKGFFEGMQNMTFDDMPKALKDAYLKANPSEEGLINMFEKDRARMVSFEDRREEEISSIKVPALIMLGDYDVITAEHAVQMSRLIKGARLCILPGTHGSFLGEAMTNEEGSRIPEVAATIIEEFLSA